MVITPAHFKKIKNIHDFLDFLDFLDILDILDILDFLYFLDILDFLEIKGGDDHRSKIQKYIRKLNGRKNIPCPCGIRS